MEIYADASNEAAQQLSLRGPRQTVGGRSNLVFSTINARLPRSPAVAGSLAMTRGGYRTASNGVKQLKIKIGNISFQLACPHQETFAWLEESFRGFIKADSKTDCFVEIGLNPSVRHRLHNDSLVQSQGNVIIERKGNRYYFSLSIASKLELGWIDPVKRMARFHYTHPAITQLYLIPFIRTGFNLFLNRTGGLLLHSAGVVRNGKGFIFTGVAGSGKTTITQSARKHGLKVLSDEFIGISRRNGTYHLFPTPWRGFKHRQVRLDRVFFLKKAKALSFKKMRPGAATLELCPNLCPTAFDENTLTKTFRNMMAFTHKMPVYQMCFALDSPIWKGIDQLEEDNNVAQFKIRPED